MNTFTDIEHPFLQAYNRAVVMHNLLQDSGKAKAEDYIKSFSKTEQKRIALIVAQVMQYGVKHVRQQLLKDAGV